MLLHSFIFVKKIFSRPINKSYLSGATSAFRTVKIFLMLPVKTVFHTQYMDRFGLHFHKKNCMPFSSTLLFTAIKTQAAENFHMGAILLF